MSSPHPALYRYFAMNEEWAKQVRQQEPGFFAESASGQAPQVGVARCL
jgi:hypothetical protein